MADMFEVEGRGMMAGSGGSGASVNSVIFRRVSVIFFRVCATYRLYAVMVIDGRGSK